jgi:hypothetical protein
LKDSLTFIIMSLLNCESMHIFVVYLRIGEQGRAGKDLFCKQQRTL